MLNRFLKAGLLTLPLLVPACTDDLPPISTSGDSSSTGATSDTMPTTTPTTVTDSVGTGSATSGSSSADTTSSPPLTTTGPGDTTTTGPSDTTDGSSGSGSSGPGSSGSGSSSGPGTTGGADDGNCCVPHPATGCEVPAVETCVCALDAFCCDTEWDDICVGEAINDCAANCPGGGTGGSTGMGSTGMAGTGGMGGDCCAANGSPGCDDPVCEAAVCALDAFCCDTEWDGICADEALMECPVLCPGGGGSGTSGGVATGGTGGSGGGTGGATGGIGGNCCFANGSPGCDDPVCEMAVCALDAFCCDTEWDGICADEALMECPVLCPGGGGSGGTGGMATGGTGGMGGGDCCAANGSPGCDDPVCEAAVCALDAFCCDTEWDGICADEALMECPVLCP